jgi:hypothetical protein
MVHLSNLGCLNLDGFGVTQGKYAAGYFDGALQLAALVLICPPNVFNRLVGDYENHQKREPSNHLLDAVAHCKRPRTIRYCQQAFD